MRPRHNRCTREISIPCTAYIVKLVHEVGIEPTVRLARPLYRRVASLQTISCELAEGGWIEHHALAGHPRFSRPLGPPLPGTFQYGGEAENRTQTASRLDGLATRCDTVTPPLQSGTRGEIRTPNLSGLNRTPLPFWPLAHIKLSKNWRARAESNCR